MHLLQLTPYYAPAYAFGGVVRAVEGLSRALVARGHSVTVLTTDALSLHERYHGPHEEWRDGVRVLRVPNRLHGLRRYNLSSPPGMRTAFRELLPTVDVLHVHEFRTVENLLVTPLAARHGLPVVLSPHGTLTYQTGRSTLKLWWDRLFSRRMAGRFAQIVALVQPELDDARALWAQFGQQTTRFTLVPNGIDLAEFDPLPDGTAFRERYGMGTARLVLFLGRLHERKGVEALVRAFQAAQLAQTTLVLAGPDEGMLERLRPLLGDNIRHTGYLDAQTRLEALSAASLFVLPATGEGLSMAVLEAMAARLPVLLSPGCNLPIVQDVGAGRIVPPEAAALREALQSMLAQPEALQQMGAAARQLVEQRFTWERVAEQMEAVYQAALRSGHDK